MNRLGHDEVRLAIDATPEWLYDLVSDVPRTPEWSPEVIACQWLDGVRDLQADLHQNMAASLAAIAQIAARQASGSPSAATARMSKSASDSQPRS
jgi:polyketide cyclase/dehydrase/lipid transport protein